MGGGYKKFRLRRYRGQVCGYFIEVSICFVNCLGNAIKVVDASAAFHNSVNFNKNEGS